MRKQRKISWAIFLRHDVVQHKQCRVTKYYLTIIKLYSLMSHETTKSNDYNAQCDAALALQQVKMRYERTCRWRCDVCVKAADDCSANVSLSATCDSCLHALMNQRLGSCRRSFAHFVFDGLGRAELAVSLTPPPTSSSPRARDCVRYSESRRQIGRKKTGVPSAPNDCNDIKRGVQ